MPVAVSPTELEAAGASRDQARSLAEGVNAILARNPDQRRDAAAQDRLWAQLRDEVLKPATPPLPFGVHRLAYSLAFDGRSRDAPPPAAWTPPDEVLQRSNLGQFMAEVGVEGYRALHRWSVDHREEFWDRFLQRLAVPFKSKPERVLDPGSAPTKPNWLPGAELNISDACFRAPADRPAMLYGREGRPGVETLTYGDVDRLVSRVAHGLDAAGLGPRDRVALYMPMTPESVAVYLGTIRSGRSVVGIADTSAPPDLANKCRIGDAKLVVTTDAYVRGGKPIPIYSKVVEARAPPAVVVPGEAPVERPTLRPGDAWWDGFLGPSEPYKSVARKPSDVTNVLFSSGTTKDPKAIAWTHTTPLKSIMDAHFHHDVHEADVLAWPTSFGWMMGPWLSYASLAHGAAMAVYNGDPRTREFGQFVHDARVTMLGVVPKLVRDWRETSRMDGLDWSRIQRFSSTGETSNPDDMLWLMRLAGYKPIVEYCGGTEIGGGYITGTVVQPASPATFSTPSLGLDLLVVDEAGRPTDRGEVAIVPPSIGLSNELLNYDHDKEYYAGFHAGPGGRPLRRHGDQLERLGGGYYRHLGRLKDMINVHGVKTSSEEIRAVLRHAAVEDTKPVAIDVEGQGQHLLVVYAVPKNRSDVGSARLRDALRRDFAAAIKRDLNPLVAHVHDVVLVEALPQAGPGKTLTSEWFRRDYTTRPARRPALGPD